MSAQIQRTFFGFTLGTTTKAEVYNKYHNENLETFHQSSPNGNCCLNYATFGGYNDWTVVFSFYNDKLYSVRLSHIDPLYKISSSFNRTLDKKYSKYYIKKESTEYDKVYLDDKTIVELIIGSYVELSYTDYSLWRSKINADESDL